MSLLIELINVLGRQKLQRLQVLQNPEKKTGKIYELYNGFRSGKFKTEEDAAMAMYQAPSSDPRYRKVRNKLRTRLVNTLMFVDANQSFFTDHSLARFNCLKLFTAQQILNYYGKSRSSLKMTKRVIKEADRYGFFYLALEASRELRGRALFAGDIKAIKENSKKIKKYLELIEGECLAEESYYSLAVSYSHSRYLKGELLEENQERERRLRPWVEKQNTPLLTYYAFSFFYLVRMLAKDYKGAIEVCENAIDRLEKSHRVVKSLYSFSFSFYILQCHLQLKNYEAGEREVHRCLKLTESGSVYNHYISRELHLLLNLHTERYEKACIIYWEAINAPRYQSLGGSIKETWKIYGAFIQYFIEIGVIKAEGIPLKESKFRLGKFLNEVPTYSKDKRGLNVPILIIQVLFLLHRRKFNDVIDRVEALNTYVYRYLKQDANYRSNCFLKMLLTLPQADFHRQAVVRKSAKYHEKLLAKPLEVSGESSELEIIPYEKLWEFVLDSLEDKFQRTSAAKSGSR